MADHYTEITDIEYGRARLADDDVALTLDLTRPRNPSSPVPLVVWIHGGGFRHGDKAWAGHRTDARWLTKAGFAYASINYRLGAKRADLSPQTAVHLDRLDPLRDPDFRRDLSGPAAMAALEDATAALNWLWDSRAEYGFSDWIALGGNSAGAITALNVVHLSGVAGLARPAIRGVVSISGGFAYPDLYAPAAAPLHALHNPDDTRVDIASIRKIATRAGPYCELIEAKDQDHGRIRLSPQEPTRDAYSRIVGFLNRIRTSDP